LYSTPTSPLLFVLGNAFSDSPLTLKSNHSGHDRIVGWLVEAAGAEVTASNAHGWTPLHSASFWNQAEVMVFLLQHGAVATARDDHGYSPLHVTGDPACIRLLLMHGGDIKYVNRVFFFFFPFLLK
jgi:ankyrin repeat protein